MLAREIPIRITPKQGDGNGNEQAGSALLHQSLIPFTPTAAINYRFHEGSSLSAGGINDNSLKAMNMLEELEERFPGRAAVGMLVKRDKQGYRSLTESAVDPDRCLDDPALSQPE